MVNAPYDPFCSHDHRQYHSAARVGERAVFCGVGRQFMKDHCHSLRCLRFEGYVWTAELSIVGSIGR